MDSSRGGSGGIANKRQKNYRPTLPTTTTTKKKKKNPSRHNNDKAMMGGAAAVANPTKKSSTTKKKSSTKKLSQMKDSSSRTMKDSSSSSSSSSQPTTRKNMKRKANDNDNNEIDGKGHRHPSAKAHGGPSSSKRTKKTVGNSNSNSNSKDDASARGKTNDGAAAVSAPASSSSDVNVPSTHGPDNNNNNNSSNNDNVSGPNAPNASSSTSVATCADSCARYMGVIFRPPRGKFEARTESGHSLGLFDLACDAALANDVAHRITGGNNNKRSNDKGGDKGRGNGDGNDYDDDDDGGDGDGGDRSKRRRGMLISNDVEEIKYALNWLDLADDASNAHARRELEERQQRRRGGKEGSSSSSSSVNFATPSSYRQARGKEVGDYLTGNTMHPTFDVTNVPREGELKMRIKKEILNLARAYVVATAQEQEQEEQGQEEEEMGRDDSSGENLRRESKEGDGDHLASSDSSSVPRAAPYPPKSSHDDADVSGIANDNVAATDRLRSDSPAAIASVNGEAPKKKTKKVKSSLLKKKTWVPEETGSSATFDDDVSAKRAKGDERPADDAAASTSSRREQAEALLALQHDGNNNNNNNNNNGIGGNAGDHPSFANMAAPPQGRDGIVDDGIERRRAEQYSEAAVLALREKKRMDETRKEALARKLRRMMGGEGAGGGEGATSSSTTPLGTEGEENEAAAGAMGDGNGGAAGNADGPPSAKVEEETKDAPATTAEGRPWAQLQANQLRLQQQALDRWRAGPGSSSSSSSSANNGGPANEAPPPANNEDDAPANKQQANQRQQLQQKQQQRALDDWRARAGSFAGSSSNNNNNENDDNDNSKGSNANIDRLLSPPLPDDGGDPPSSDGIGGVGGAGEDSSVLERVLMLAGGQRPGGGPQIDGDALRRVMSDRRSRDAALKMMVRASQIQAQLAANGGVGGAVGGEEVQRQQQRTKGATGSPAAALSLPTENERKEETPPRPEEALSSETPDAQVAALLAGHRGPVPPGLAEHLRAKLEERRRRAGSVAEDGAPDARAEAILGDRGPVPPPAAATSAEAPTAQVAALLASMGHRGPVPPGLAEQLEATLKERQQQQQQQQQQPTVEDRRENPSAEVPNAQVAALLASMGHRGPVPPGLAEQLQATLKERQQPAAEDRRENPSAEVPNAQVAALLASMGHRGPAPPGLAEQVQATLRERQQQQPAAEDRRETPSAEAPNAQVAALLASMGHRGPVPPGLAEHLQATLRERRPSLRMPEAALDGPAAPRGYGDAGEEGEDPQAILQRKLANETKKAALAQKLSALMGGGRGSETHGGAAENKKDGRVGREEDNMPRAPPFQGTILSGPKKTASPELNANGDILVRANHDQVKRESHIAGEQRSQSKQCDRGELKQAVTADPTPSMANSKIPENSEAALKQSLLQDRKSSAEPENIASSIAAPLPQQTPLQAMQSLQQGLLSSSGEPGIPEGIDEQALLQSILLKKQMAEMNKQALEQKVQDYIQGKTNGIAPQQQQPHPQQLSPRMAPSTLLGFNQEQLSRHIAMQSLLGGSQQQGLLHQTQTQQMSADLAHQNNLQNLLAANQERRPTNNCNQISDALTHDVVQRRLVIESMLMSEENRLRQLREALQNPQQQGVPPQQQLLHQMGVGGLAASGGCFGGRVQFNNVNGDPRQGLGLEGERMAASGAANDDFRRAMLAAEINASTNERRAQEGALRQALAQRASQGAEISPERLLEAARSHGLDPQTMTPGQLEQLVAMVGRR